MNTIKVRIELQLEAGDIAPMGSVLADALVALGAHMIVEDGAKMTGMVDVPRGQAVYLTEVNGRAARFADDGLTGENSRGP